MHQADVCGAVRNSAVMYLQLRKEKKIWQSNFQKGKCTEAKTLENSQIERYNVSEIINAKKIKAK
jgi:hypothetical protein